MVSTGKTDNAQGPAMTCPQYGTHYGRELELVCCLKAAGNRNCPARGEPLASNCGAASGIAPAGAGKGRPAGY